MAITEQLEILAFKIEELAELCPALNNAGCAARVRNSAFHLTAMPDDLVPVIQASWPQLAGLIDEVKAKVLPVAKFMNPQSEQCRAICEPQPCPSGPTEGQIDDVLIAAAAVQISATIAQGVADAIPEPFNAYAVAIATGLQVAVDTLNLTAAILQKSLNEINACEEAAFQQVVYSMCDSINQILDSLNSLHNKVDLIGRKVDILLRLAVELTALAKEIMLREIEGSLADCRQLTSLYLPTAEGGRLETIGELLLKLINASKTAGLDTGVAEAYLKMGMAAAANKDSCQAFSWFSQAYRQLSAVACCDFAKASGLQHHTL